MNTLIKFVLGFIVSAICITLSFLTIKHGSSSAFDIGLLLIIFNVIAVVYISKLEEK